MWAAQWITAAKLREVSSASSRGRIGEVAHHELGLLRRPAVAGIQAVIDDRPVAGIEQVADDEAADVAGAAGDQHVQPGARRLGDH